MRLMTTALFLCCLFEPLLGQRFSDGLDLSALPETVQNEMLARRISEQLREQVEEAATEQARLALERRKIEAENISVKTDIDDNGGIYIEQIVVTLDKQNKGYSLTVSQLLEQQFGVSVKIVSNGTAASS